MTTDFQKEKNVFFLLKMSVDCRGYMYICMYFCFFRDKLLSGLVAGLKDEDPNVRKV